MVERYIAAELYEMTKDEACTQTQTSSLAILISRMIEA